MTQDERNKIAFLYEEGMNPEDIAEELGLDEVDVMNYCADIL